jgi:hypothetical protein
VITLRHSLPHTLALCALLFAVATPAHAQWKWRDASGSVQFSDRPPPISVPERDILKRPGQAAVASTSATNVAQPGREATPAGAHVNVPPTPRASGPAVDPELDKRRKAEEAEKAAKTKADDERRKAIQADNCSRARSAVATFESGQRVARFNEKGEREVMDDRQRNDELKRAKEIVSSDCR